MKLRSILSAILFVAIGTTLGFLLAHRSAPPAVANLSASASIDRQTAPAAPVEKTTRIADKPKPARSLADIRAALANLSAPSPFDKRLQAVIDAAESVDDSDLAEALKLADRLPAGPLKSAYLRTLLSRWAAKDPGAA